MYPFQNILFTTDFSANSKSALKYAAAFAQKHGATLFIHNSQESTLPPQALKLSDRSLSENGYDWVMAIKKEMEELSNSPLLNGLPLRMILSEGGPVQEIPRVIREYKIDLTLMGTTARASIGGGIGSTALGVIGKAGCPVLLTRQSMHDFVFYKDSATTIALNRILFATDFSEFDESAKKMAFELARTHQSQLIILHSIGTFLGYLQSVSVGRATEIETHVRQDANDKLTQIAGEAVGIQSETLLTEGRLYDEVLRVATERDIDLIIIGTGRQRSSATMPGRHAERVVRGAPCPVLTIRHGTV